VISASPTSARSPLAIPCRRFASPIDTHPLCYILSHMKTTTVRELRNNYSKVLKWVAKGEEVDVTRRGKIVAKVVPPSAAKATQVDWSQSAALNRRVWSTTLTAAESGAILTESQGH
jgi:prevent-host-death family protein